MSEPTVAVDQPTMAPTSKLTAATMAAGLMSLVYYGLEWMAPTMPNEQLVTGVTPLVVFAAGWFTRERIPVSKLTVVDQG